MVTAGSAGFGAEPHPYWTRYLRNQLVREIKCGPALGLRNKEDLSMLGCGLVLVVYVLAMKMNANTLPWVLNIQLTIALLMVALGLIRLALDRRR